MNSIKRPKPALAFAIALALAFAMPSAPPDSAVTANAAVVRLNKAKKTLHVGEEFRLKIIGTKKAITWESSRPSVATVSKKGKVKAVSAGRADITAKAAGKKYTCKVTVKASEKAEDKRAMKMKIGDTEVSVDWENNESAQALRELCAARPLKIEMSMYGGFEQVGSLGRSLPHDDSRITTDLGDIVLYGGDQIVVFYGTNTWPYTRLGRITGKTESEIRELLSGGNVSVTIEAGGSE